MPLKILHICNNYYGTSVYSELFKELEKKKIENHILVFVPKSKKFYSTMDRSKSKKNVNKILIPNIINLLSRFVPILRVLFLIKKLKKLKNMNIDVIHSHTLHSNGTIGRWLSSKISKPNISSIRNVDINTVYKKFFFYRKSILNKIITGINLFPNKAFFNFINKEIKNKKIKNKKRYMHIIPNSVDNFWIKNKFKVKKIENNIINILFVGEFTSNKNIEFLLDVFEEQWLKGITFRIKIIGYLNKNLYSNKVYYERIKNRTKNNKNVIVIINMKDKKKLLSHYRSGDIFFMTSYKETFGLVYLEAMSQGLPMIFTENQGIDGFYKNGEIGYSVDPTNIKKARSTVKILLKNYQQISKRCLSFVDDFSYKKNIKKLMNLYNFAKENKK